MTEKCYADVDGNRCSPVGSRSYLVTNGEQQIRLCETHYRALRALAEERGTPRYLGVQVRVDMGFGALYIRVKRAFPWLRGVGWSWEAGGSPAWDMIAVTLLFVAAMILALIMIMIAAEAILRWSDLRPVTRGVV